MTRTWPLACLLAACAGGGGGTADRVGEAVVAVVTLQSGTVSSLRERRGEGPFRFHDLPPGEMIEVVERAVRRARDRTGRAPEVFVAPHRGEVVAKERKPPEGARGRSSLAGEAADGYGEPFLSAVLVMVNPVNGRPGESRVEIHATDRGTFHCGSIRWERDLPRWIDEEEARRAAERARPISPLR